MERHRAFGREITSGGLYHDRMLVFIVEEFIFSRLCVFLHHRKYYPPKRQVPKDHDDVSVGTRFPKILRYHLRYFLNWLWLCEEEKRSFCTKLAIISGRATFVI